MNCGVSEKAAAFAKNAAWSASKAFGSRYQEVALAGANLGMAQALATFDPGGGASLETWAHPYMRREATRAVLTEIGSTRRGNSLPTVGLDDAEEELSTVRCARNETESEICSRLDVWAAVRDLDPRDRRAVWLIYWEGRTLPEAAKEVGISVSTLKLWMSSRILPALRMALGEAGCP